jgi:predicted double-glycine peptidase
MLTTLAAALSLAASLAIDVPYLPQTDALCGGAATAMVFRYWGDTHADVQEFSGLVDRRAGGIAADALTAAVQARGWRTQRIEGSLDALGARVRDRQPVIVLLPDRGDRYHYVVVTGISETDIVVHDPAWGPSRAIRAADFERAWKAASFWSLVILPPRSTDANSALDPKSPAGTAAAEALDACDVRLNRAMDEIRAQGLDRADVVLGEVRALCPAAAGPIRELSGVRFAQRRWRDAVVLAREALSKQSDDEYALDVLGSALFMQDDEIGALQAWNRIGKPHVNRVRIEGLHHTRYQMVAALMGIQPNMLLTAEDYARARRRLAELPDRITTRLAVKPEADGFATIDVVVVEIAPVPHGAIEWVGASARTLANRELDIAVPGTSGQGEVWSAGWRWMPNRPRMSVGFTAPYVRGLPGVWRVDGAWTSDSYDGAGHARLVETQSHAGLTMSDWMSGGLRYSVTGGLDAWSGNRKAASIGGTLQRVALADRLLMSVSATRWAPLTGESAFASAAAQATVRSSADIRDWVMRGTVGYQRVDDAAPMSLWPGAGEGQARAPLLRAHPMLDDGVVDLTGSSVFGRSLAFGSAELQRWLEPLPLVRIGIAGFTDVARASRQLSSGETPVQVDAGIGLRLKIPGTPGLLRADVARGLRDGANALTLGWIF